MLTSKNTKKNEDEKSFEKIQFFTRILMILHLCQIWSQSEFCQKDIQTAFSFLFSSVLIATRWLNNSNAYNLHLLSTSYSREKKYVFWRIIFAVQDRQAVYFFTVFRWSFEIIIGGLIRSFCQSRFPNLRIFLTNTYYDIFFNLQRKKLFCTIKVSTVLMDFVFAKIFQLIL